MTDFNKIEITNVKFWERTSGALVAFADVTINGMIQIKGFKVFKRKDGSGYWASGPSVEKEVDGEKKYYDSLWFNEDMFDGKKNLFTEEVASAYVAKLNGGNSASDDEDIPF